MSHENIARRLKAACAAAAVLGIAVFLAWARALLNAAPESLPGIATLRWPMAVWVLGIGALCCLSLWQFWGVCGRIGEDRSFSPENAAAMERIARYLWLASGMSAAFAAPLLTLSAVSGEGILPDGGMAMPAFVACVAAGMALLSKALSLLLAKAVELQTDHDLTV